MLKRPLPSLCAAVIALSLIAVPAFTQTIHNRPHTAANKSVDPAKDQVLDYTTSWIGNTFGGFDPKPPNDTMLHVPLDMDSIYVTPDGRVFTNVIWEEGGRAVSVFKDGRLISPLNDLDGSPNWANGGGVAVASDGNRIFVGYAPNGTGVGILSAKDLTNTGLSLNGSSTLANSHGIFAMTIAKKKLYVTENDVNLVEVFDLNNLSLLNSFTVQNPVRIAVDAKGGMWVSHRDPTPLPATPAGNVYDINGQMGLATIDHFDSSGTWINSITLPEGGEVGALWIDSDGALLVGDDGPDQNIKIYSNILTNPVLSSTFGVTGGNYAGPVPGQVGPQRFRGITGIGTDAKGNIYVSQSGFGLDMGVGHGVVLQSYSWWGGLNWEVNGLGFVSLASVDPRSDTDVYDAYHHFKVDYSKPAGQEATYVADTYDRFKYPDDVRVTSIMSTGQVQYIHGKKFLVVSGQYGVQLEMYRFKGKSEIAIPCVAFDYGSFQNGNYQDFDVEPIDGEFIWRDLNGDGRMTLDEFLEPPNNNHRDGGYYWVDTNGDVWQVSYQAENPPYESSIHLRRFLFQGFDANGAPVYDYSHLRVYDTPADIPDLTDVQKAVFLPNSAGGTLYVAGNAPGQGSFSKIARYDHWDKGNRKATWVIDIPWDPDPNNTWSPNSFTVAGDFLFVDFWVPHYNIVFSLKNGAYVGRFTPGKSVGGAPNVGNTDEWQANSAHRLWNGEYVLLQEEDFQAKYLMYRWFPPATLPTPPVPQPPANLQALPDDEAAAISWIGGPDALIYNVGRSTTKGGPYTIVDSGVYQTSVSDVGLINGQTYYYVVTAEADTGLSSVNSPELSVTAVAAGTTYEAENGILGGCAQVFAGPKDSGGYRVGCMAPDATITLNNVTVPTTGTYAMRIYYGNGDNNSSDLYNMGVIVNGGSIVYSQNMPFTGDWAIPGYVTMNVQLNAGANTIVVGNQDNDTAGGPDIDRIVVPFAPLPTN